MKWILPVLWLILAGCAHTLKTETGYPEVDIAGHSTDEIMRTTHHLLTRRGYVYLGNDALGMVFEKAVSEVGREMYSSEMAAAFLRLRVHILRREKDHKVIASGAIISRLGTIENETAADNDGNHEIQKLLKEIKHALN